MLLWQHLCQCCWCCDCCCVCCDLLLLLSTNLAQCFCDILLCWSQDVHLVEHHGQHRFMMLNRSVHEPNKEKAVVVRSESRERTCGSCALSQLWIKNLVEKSIRFFRLDLVRSSRIGLGWKNSFVLRFNLYQYFRFVV